MKARFVLALIGAAALLAAGCGGPTRLGDDGERQAVEVAEVDLGYFCVDVLTADLNAASSPRHARLYSKALDATETLIRVFRRDPNAIYGPEGEQRTMRQVLADRAFDMSGCDRGITDDLDRTLTTR